WVECKRSESQLAPCLCDDRNRSSEGIGQPEESFLDPTGFVSRDPYPASMTRILLLLLLVCAACEAVPALPLDLSGVAAGEVLTQRMDRGRTGANPSEMLLRPGNVGALVLRRTIPVDDQVYAQPLVVVLERGAVLVVATAAGSLMAYDLDDAAA